MVVIRVDKDRLRWPPAKPVPVAAPVAAELRGHWQRMREGNRLPRRDALDPRALAPLLGSVFVVDWTDAGAARLRIAGQVFSSLYGMELHGAPLALLFEPSERAAIGRVLRTVCDEPAAVDLVLRSEGKAGRPDLRARMLVLPLLDRRGVASYAIGSLEVAGMIGLAPRRFRIERTLRTPL